MIKISKNKIYQASKKIAFFVVFIVTMNPLLVSSQENKKVVLLKGQEILIRQAVEAISREDYPEAERLYLAALKLGEVNIIYQGLGRLYQKQGKCEESKIYFDLAFQADFVDHPSPSEVNQKIKKYLEDDKDLCYMNLIIECFPKDISLRFKENPLLEIRCDQPVKLPLRPYTLIADAKNYHQKEELISFSSGRTQIKQISLLPLESQNINLNPSHDLDKKIVNENEILKEKLSKNTKKSEKMYENNIETQVLDDSKNGKNNKVNPQVSKDEEKLLLSNEISQIENDAHKISVLEKNKNLSESRTTIDNEQEKIIDKNEFKGDHYLKEKSSLSPEPWIMIGFGMVGIGVGFWGAFEINELNKEADQLAKMKNITNVNRANYIFLEGDRYEIIQWLGFGVGTTSVIAGLVWLGLQEEVDDDISWIPWIFHDSLGASYFFYY